MKITPRFNPTFADRGPLHDVVSVKIGNLFSLKGTTRSGLIWFSAGVGGLLLFNVVKEAIKAKIALKVYKGKKQIDREYDKSNPNKSVDPPGSTVSVPNAPNATVDNTTEVRSWLENFNDEFPFGWLELPPIINGYFGNCPQGFEVPVILALTAELALCFSKVEAKYLDGRYHRANIQTLIEGQFGSGKGHIKRMRDTLFKRRIERDKEKISNPDGKKKIIQTITPNVSGPALIDVLANNSGVHAIVMDPEAKTIVEAIKKGGGITYELLRKAYDNDELDRMNRDKNAPQGSFTIALNLLITGTPDDMEALVGKQHEGGTSSRMALGVLPNPGRDLPNFPMLEGNTLEYMQDQIDEWTEKFSYHTDENGDDVPAQTHTIDLDYVADALRKWILEQYDLGVEENNQARMDLRTRIASTVFNCAIVWHMLFDEPGPEDDNKRMSIVKLCIYMANYLMERWLHKYGQKHNAIRWKNMLDEMVKTKLSPDALKSPEARLDAKQPPKDNADRNKTFFELYTQGKGSYGEIAKMFGVTKNTVSSAVHRYGEKLNGNSPLAKAV